MAESYLESQNGSVQDTQSNAAQPLGAWASRPRPMHSVIKHTQTTSVLKYYLKTDFANNPLLLSL